MEDGYDFAVFGTRLAVALELGFWELLIGRVGRLFGCPLPRSAGTRTLLVHRCIKTCLVERDTSVTSCVLHEIQRHSKCVVEFEGLLAGEMIFGQQRFEL